MIKFFNIDKEYFIKNVILFLLIYSSFETLLFGTNILMSFKVYMILIYLLLLFIMLMMIYIKEKKLTFSKHNISKTFVLISLIVFTQVYSYIKGYSFFNPQYFYNMLLIIMALVIGKLYSQKDFENMFVNIIYWISIFGILIYFLIILRIEIPHFIVINKSNFVFYHYLISCSLTNGSLISRLYSIFREPGVYAIFLLIALFFELFSNEKISLKKIIVFMISIILTFSTSGYILMSLFLLVYLFFFKTHSKKILFLKILLIIISFFILCSGINDDINSLVFGKLYKENLSLNSRIYSLYAGFTLSLKNFFFGYGWDYIINNWDEFVDKEFYVLNISFTNTYLRMACTYGWIFASIILLYTFKFLKHKSSSLRQYICFIVIWLIMFSNENFLLNPIIYSILFLEDRKYEKS